MHIHLNEATTQRDQTCNATGTDLLVSVDTIRDFTGMDQEMTETWLRQIGEPTHECGERRYVPCHRILRFLTRDNRPAMEERQAIEMLTAKLARYVGAVMAGGEHTAGETMGAVRDAIVREARIHGCGAREGSHYLVTRAMTGLPVG